MVKVTSAFIVTVPGAVYMQVSINTRSDDITDGKSQLPCPEL